MTSHTPKSTIQGEGDYDSARKYNAQTKAFAQSGKAEQAAREAAPRTDQEQDEMRKAEAEGRSHAKGQGNVNQGNVKRDKGTPDRRDTAREAPDKHPQGRTPEKFPGR